MHVIQVVEVGTVFITPHTCLPFVMSLFYISFYVLFHFIPFYFGIIIIIAVVVVVIVISAVYFYHHY